MKGYLNQIKYNISLLGSRRLAIFLKGVILDNICYFSQSQHYSLDYIYVVGLTI